MSQLGPAGIRVLECLRGAEPVPPKDGFVKTLILFLIWGWRVGDLARSPAPLLPEEAAPSGFCSFPPVWLQFISPFQCRGSGTFFFSLKAAGSLSLITGSHVICADDFFPIFPI